MVIIALLSYPTESVREMARRLMEQPPLPAYITMKGHYVTTEVGVGIKSIAIYEPDKSRYAEAFEFIVSRYAKYLGVPGFTYSANTWLEPKEAIELSGIGQKIQD